MTADTLTVLFLFSTVALRVALVALVIWLLIPRRRRCPACGADTAALVTGRVLTWLALERRWCLDCGWAGVAKRTAASVRPERQPTAPLRTSDV